MAKIIFLLRHAQSAGKQSGQRDYDRLLTPQGEVEARTNGKKISDGNYFPDLILCSGAARTRKTLELFYEFKQLLNEKIQFREDLYDAAMTHLLDIIQGLPDDVNKVMLIGHNPGISLLASDLSTRIVDMSTCQLVGYEFQVDSWLDIDSCGKEILNIK